MRLAFFSPLPPKKTGIADYSEALLQELQRLVEVDVYDSEPRQFDPGRYDALLYQLGNNEHHEFVYRMALRHPGIVVLHELNLHHLLAEITIKRGHWDAYIQEVLYEAGPEAARHAERVRQGLAGPDYHGVPMLRRVLESARAIIVHSRYMAERLRSLGFCGPVAQIPHGAWIPQVDRLSYRYRLGLDETTPLVGIFGFLKPYKRIPETLRAFARLLKLEPRARMILVGEPHPELPLEPLVRSLGLEAQVRRMGYVQPADFTGYMAACDIVINLRWPTVGETSGTLLRAMGLGKPVLVSEVGAFAEFPDGLCLKVPVDASEEDVIFEYLNLLVSRPEVARQIGRQAQQWVQQECNWPRVARLYAEFAAAVAHGQSWPGAASLAAVQAEPVMRTGVVAAGTERQSAPPPPASGTPGDVDQWPPTNGQQAPDPLLDWIEANPDPAARQYAETHLARLRKTLELIPPGQATDRILELGTYLQITPALHFVLGYGEVRGAYYGPAGKTEHRVVRSTRGQEFHCQVDLFDAELDPFPYPDEYFATVLCCEIIEHLSQDPMHMMSEINRVLRPGGHVVLTTPNIVSLRSIAAVLEGYHPGLFPAYLVPGNNGERDQRHHREYTPREVVWLLWDAGFELVRLETGPFRELPRPELAWVEDLLRRYKLPTEYRGDGIYAVARKIGPVKRRYPPWLYSR